MNIGTNLGLIVGYKPKAPLLARTREMGHPAYLKDASRMGDVCHPSRPQTASQNVDSLGYNKRATKYEIVANLLWCRNNGSTTHAPEAQDFSPECVPIVDCDA